MRDLKPSNREAELTAIPRVGSGAVVRPSDKKMSGLKPENPCWCQSTWEVEALWKGDIEYEKAEIESPLKVALMVARSLRGGCVSVSIVRKTKTVAARPNASNSATGDRGASPAKADGKA